MPVSWSIDEVVRTSDEDAVRAGFADRNRAWLTFLLIFHIFPSFIAAVRFRKTPTDVILAVANLGLIAFCLFVMRYAARQAPGDQTFLGRAGTLVRRHTNAVALVYVAVQFAFALGMGHGTTLTGWMMTFPLLMLGFRMLPPELVLLHGYIVAGGLLVLITSRNARDPGMYAAMIVMNLLAVAFELWSSRRRRRQIVSEWTSRRTSAREQVRMRDELRYARELQLSMLPECAPKLDWADVSSISMPATEVGGDYYDYFVEQGGSEDRVALVCMDVAGHGMASGLVLAALRSGFTLLRDSLNDPAAVLQRLHELVAETSRRRMLVTVSVVLLDRTSRTATIASAGNPPVFIRRADADGTGVTVETINLYAPPLGVRLPVEIPQRRLDVAPGDVIVLHSDGIYETRSPTDEVYGLDRIAQIIQQQGGDTAETLRDAILADVASFRGTGEQDDDVTLMVCRLT